MPRTVWKYTIPVDDRWHGLPLEPLAVVVHVDTIDEIRHVTLWVELDPEWEVERPREFRVFGTGQPLPEGEPVAHRGTALSGVAYRGQLVWHLYESVGTP